MSEVEKNDKVNLSEILTKDHTIDESNITFNKSAYKEGLVGYGMSMDDIRKVEKYNGDFISALETECGKLSGGIFSGDSELSKITGVAPFGTRGSIRSTVTKSAKRMNPKTKESNPGPTILSTVNWTGTKGNKSNRSIAVKNLEDALSE